MRYLLIILFILIIQNVYATCSEGQIDINSAPKEELVEIIYIGEVRAEELISLRPFESVEELIEIKGIGEVYLSKIKEQGLDCVNGIEEEDEKEEAKNVEEIKEDKELGNSIKEVNEDNVQKEPELEIIKLNTKNIKTENDKKEQPEKTDKSNYATYSFVFFCVLLGFLFAIKKIKFRKNEFD